LDQVSYHMVYYLAVVYKSGLSDVIYK